MTINHAEERERLEALRNQAWAALTKAVTAHQIPHVKTLKCKDCGRKAEEYHHHLGYDEPNWLNVIPLCVKCHRRMDQAQAVKCQAVDHLGNRCGRRIYRGYDFCHLHYQNPEMSGEPFSLRAPAELIKGLKYRAQGASVSVVIRRLVEMYVNDEVKVDLNRLDD